MRRLILMRHAEAGAATGAGDHARALTPNGRSEAYRAGEALAALVRPHYALVSDSRRTRETFEIVQDRLGGAVAHHFSRELYGAASDAILAATRDLPPSIRCLLVIGHNPGIGDLVSVASRGADDAGVAQPTRFPTASFAVLAADGPFEDFARECRLERSFTVDAGLRPPAG